MLPVFSCFMYSVLNSFFRLSACLTANAVCRQHIPHRDHYLVAVVAMGMRLWFTQSVAYFERIICYMNAKHVLYVLLLWVRFPYWEMPFWVIMYRVVDITTTHHVITQKNTVLIYRGADKSLAWPDWKKLLRGRHFPSDMEVIAAAETCWTDNLLNFFLSVLQKLEFGRCSFFPSWSG